MIKIDRGLSRAQHLAQQIYVACKYQWTHCSACLDAPSDIPLRLRVLAARIRRSILQLGNTTRFIIRRAPETLLMLQLCAYWTRAC